MRTKCWDCHWKERVESNAEMSTCRTRKVGGVLVRANRVVADGFNGNLPKHLHCDEGGCPRCNDPGTKSGEHLDRCYCVHAEQNILSYCAKNGVTSHGGTLYLPFTPCLDCFKLVVLSGIWEIVYDNIYPKAEESVRELAIKSHITIRKYICRCKDASIQS
jgi:dCMP deaminase